MRMSLQSNAVSHWLGANLESALARALTLPIVRQLITLYIVVAGLPVQLITSRVKSIILIIWRYPTSVTWRYQATCCPASLFQFYYPGTSCKTMFNSCPLPRQYSRLFADDIFRCIFVNKKFYILIAISLTVVPKGPMLTHFTDAYMRH